MHRSFNKAVAIFMFIFGYVCSFIGHAQTITFHDVDPGQYTPGSTIAAPFKLDYSSGCVAQDNVYELYLSDALGNFTAEKKIGQFTGFYATFVNGVIPAGTVPGVGYRLRVKTTKPATVSAASGAITINAGAAVTAGLGGNFINSDPTSPNYHQVFGYCAAGSAKSFDFNETSASTIPIVANGATTTVYNEKSSTSKVQYPQNGYVRVDADATNYTIIEKAFNGVSVGTYAYQLINNPVSNNVGASGTLDLCLIQNRNSAVIRISPDGLGDNYPGNIYTVDFGDGTIVRLSICDLQAANYNISHLYTESSCGKQSNGGYPINEFIQTPYCTGVYGTPFNTSAKVYTNPYNKITGSTNGCSNKELTFTNSSYPGQNLTGGALNCINFSARYNWSVDGVVVLRNVPLSTPLKQTFAAGNHKILLELLGSTGTCDFADPVSMDICVQDPPKPDLDIPSRVCLSSPVTPDAAKSVVDNRCNIAPVYTWTVRGISPVVPSKTYTGTAPSIPFTAAGTYGIVLAITSGQCDQVLSAEKTIIVDAQPTATLSKDVSVCTKTLTFSNADGITKTTFAGTTVPVTDTYQWSATPNTYTFAAGSNANSQYPTFVFQENTIYTVTVIHKNTCGQAPTATQKITIQDAPKVEAGSYDPVCSSDQKITLSKAVSDVSTFTWTTNGTGKFSDNSINPTYTFSAADIAKGSVNLTLTATTALAAPCNQIQSTTPITILPQAAITSSLAPTVCSGQPANYTITSNAPGATFTWTASSPNGVTGFTATGSGNTINDIFTAAGNTAGTVIYNITPAANGCPGIPQNVTITVRPLPSITATPVNTEICSGTNATINLTSNVTGTTYTWKSTAQGSITGNVQQTIPVAASQINETLVNGSTTAKGSVTYVITSYNGTCEGETKTITITVTPAPVVAKVVKPSDEICGAATSYQLQGNAASPSTGEWTVVSPSDAVVTFSPNANTANATINGLLPGTTYQLKWTIPGAAGCPSSFATFTLIVDKISVGGTTKSNLSSNTVCSGNNSGIITLSGYTGNVVRWQLSTDGFKSDIQNQANNSATFNFGNLTTTTQFRAVVQSGVCDIAYSEPTTITVNPAIGIVNAGPDQPNLCNTQNAQLQAVENVNGGTWVLTSTDPGKITFSNANSASTTVTGLIPGNQYTFRWTVTSASCGAPQFDDVVLTDNADIQPSFKSSTLKACGSTPVTFTNTSYGNNVITPPAGAKFLWTYTDGTTPQTVTTFSPTITLPASTSKDIIYHVTLQITTNCIIPLKTASADILISPATPVSSLTTGPTSGCLPFKPTAEAFLFGTGANNAKYTYYIIDKSTNAKIQTKEYTDKTSQPVFDEIAKSGSYAYQMVVTDNCGNKGTSIEYPFTVLPPDVNPAFAIKNQKRNYCFGEGLTLQNGSAGGTVYTYYITNTTTNEQITLAAGVSGTETPWTPPKTGIYSIKINGISDCKPKGQDSDPKTITVYALPVPSFTSDKKPACGSLTVQFVNTTINNEGTPASSLTYNWDFGDSTDPDKTYTPAPHTYNRPGSYTVTLTVTNTATGCSSISSISNYIVVTTPPTADFSVSPGLITAVPNYTFKFTDRSTGVTPASWSWTFGDGKPAESSKNPTHTYDDPGTYKVRLVVTGSNGCPSFVEKTVEITGVRGELFIPNAFIPTSATGELRTFKAKGMGLKAYHLQIFNNYGQLMWETTQLTADGAPAEAWDGTFRGAPVPQGVYIWQMSGTFISGSDWKGMSYNDGPPKRTGVVHLIR